MYKIARKAVLVSLWAFSLAQGAAAVECVDGLYMIVARGTGEPYDTAGDLERVAKRVAERIDGSAISPVHYPATFTNPWHVESIRDGAIDARAKITEYAKSCPGKIALLGYSQGAQVIGNAVCGDRAGDAAVVDPNVACYNKNLLCISEGHTQFSNGDAVDKNIAGDKIISVILMGDPTNKHGLDFDKGTGRTDGLWPRNWADCGNYTGLMQSYCDVGDIFCDATSPYQDPNPHVLYVSRYGVEAVKFILQKWNAVSGADPLPEDGGAPFPVIPDKVCQC